MKGWCNCCDDDVNLVERDGRLVCHNCGTADVIEDDDDYEFDDLDDEWEDYDLDYDLDDDDWE